MTITDWVDDGSGVSLSLYKCSICEYSAMYGTQYIVDSIQYTVYSVQFTVNRVQYTEYTEYSRQCTVHSV